MQNIYIYLNSCLLASNFYRVSAILGIELSFCLYILLLPGSWTAVDFLKPLEKGLNATGPDCLWEWSGWENPRTWWWMAGEMEAGYLMIIIRTNQNYRTLERKIQRLAEMELRDDQADVCICYYDGNFFI